MNVPLYSIRIVYFEMKVKYVDYFLGKLAGEIKVSICIGVHKFALLGPGSCSQDVIVYFVKDARTNGSC